MTDLFPKYVIDSSSIIAGHTELYRAENFPDIWINQKNLILNETMYIPDQVRDEVKHIEDDANEWLAQTNGQGFQPTDVQQTSVDARWTALASTQNNKMAAGADLWVVAWELEFEAFAVSHEAPNRPNKIPTVIQASGGKAMNLSGMIAAEKWRFVNVTALSQ